MSALKGFRESKASAHHHYTPDMSTLCHMLPSVDEDEKVRDAGHADEASGFTVCGHSLNGYLHRNGGLTRSLPWPRKNWREQEMSIDSPMTRKVIEARPSMAVLLSAFFAQPRRLEYTLDMCRVVEETVDLSRFYCEYVQMQSQLDLVGHRAYPLARE
jgi:hypothetical protein